MYIRHIKGSGCRKGKTCSSFCSILHANDFYKILGYGGHCPDLLENGTMTSQNLVFLHLVNFKGS